MALDRGCEHGSEVLDHSLQKLVDRHKVLVKFEFVAFVDRLAGLQVLVGLQTGSVVRQRSEPEGVRTTSDRASS